MFWPQGAEQPLPATCVFLAFAFPFQAFPLSAADEGWHGGIAVFSFCKQTNNIALLTCPDICKGEIIPTVQRSQTRNSRAA